MADFPLLSSLVVLPLAGAVAVGLLPRARRELFLPVGVAVSLLPLGAAAHLFLEFSVGEPDFQFVERMTLYEPWGFGWHLGVDGISVLLVVLTALLVPIALAASTSITDRVKQFVVATLLLEAGLIGVFLSLDLLLFFVFFEVILVPMYFIIAIWGSDRRIYAATKFFLFTAFGSALMLGGIVALGLQALDQTGRFTLDYVDLLGLDLSRSTQLWMFGVFALA
ncbi:MAG TPA: proton-conducting transporter membrane subunit, partial [Acidimicrobiia bacterium]